MDEQIMHFDWSIQVSSSPLEIWPLLSDTNRLFESLGRPSVQKSDLSYELKAGHLQLSYNSIHNSDAWEEEPFEWEYPYRFGVKRHYKNGKYKYLKIQVDLFPHDRGTKVKYQVWASARNLMAHLLISLKMRTVYRKKLRKTVRTFDSLVQRNKMPYEEQARKKLIGGGHRRLKQYREDLITHTGNISVVNKLVQLILFAKDTDLRSINPIKLADHWKADRQEVISVFLHATKVGLLNFSWDLLCTNCRTVQQRFKSLKEIHEPVICDSCQIDFSINFNRNVQLSFKPNPLIRKISDARYSLTGPHLKPHIAAKQYLHAGEKRYLKIQLEPGIYELRATDTKGKAKIVVTENGRENIMVRVTQLGLRGEAANIIPEPNLVLHNQTNRDQIFILENTAWNSDVLTAAHVTSLQLFRDLFDKEVLRKGEQIAVDNQTLMFTDLFNSTGMYKNEGDEKAVGKVIEHFDILEEAVANQNGAVVKTIGDSVMAVFNNPADAFMAYVQAHQAISNDNRFKKLKLKAGIHHGSCVAANLNNKIDYFGSTVNIASRLVDYANENEVILSETVSRIIEQYKSLNSGYVSESADINLRGFDDEKFQVKRLRLNNASLRLVV